MFFTELNKEASEIAGCFRSRVQRLLHLHVPSGLQRCIWRFRQCFIDDQQIMVQEGRMLLNYVTMNAIAIRKILKKYDKVSVDLLIVSRHIQCIFVYLYSYNPADTWFCEWQRFQEQDANWAYWTVAVTLADRAWCFPSQLWWFRCWWTWSWRVLQEWILQEFFLWPEWNTATTNNDHFWDSEVWVQPNLSDLLGEIFFNFSFLWLINIKELKG